MILTIPTHGLYDLKCSQIRISFLFHDQHRCYESENIRMYTLA